MKDAIKKMLKESEDDWGWVEDVQVNPWAVYEAIIFDVTPDEYNVEKLIRLCLGYRGESIGNFDEWTEEEMETDVNNIVDRSSNPDRDYLILGINDRGNLSYTRNPDMYDIDNSIYYSELLKSRILRESEDDGLDWIRETPNIHDLIQPGNAFFCQHCGKKHFMGLLKLIEQKYPKVRWSGGQTPTGFYTGEMITLYFGNNGRLSYGTSLKPNYIKYSVVHIDSYRNVLELI